MTASPTGPDPRLLAPDFAARFSALIAQLIGFIALRLGRHPKLAALTPLFCNRLNRAARIIAATMARLAAGKPPRLRRPEPNRIRTRKDCVRPKLPTSPGWLLRELKHEAAIIRAHLETLLAQPGIADLLAQAPTLQRRLNPLRRALAIGYPGPRRRPAPPPAAIPQPQPTTQPPQPAPRRARFVSFVRIL